VTSSASGFFCFCESNDYACLQESIFTKTVLSLYNELKRRNVLRVTTAYIVASWLAIQVVETLFPAFGFGDAAVRIVSVTLAIGFIPTLILSWAFEITPEGLKKEKDVDRSQSITTRTSKKLAAIEFKVSLPEN